MTASNKNDLPLAELTNDDNAIGFEAITPVEAAGEPSVENGNPVEPAAQITIGDESAPETLAEGAGADEHTDEGGEFHPAPMRAGEFVVPLSKLGEWQHHPRRGSRLIGAHSRSLMLSAADPASLQAIIVLPEVDGVHPIVDGRFRWAALRETHNDGDDVEVRCILFDGTEKEAVAAKCDATLGTIGASAIEQAQALLSLTQTNGVGRTAIANRYVGLTVSKVSNMLIAAEMKTAYRALFDILHEPDRAPISYGVELNKVRKTLGEAFTAVLDRAAELAANGERFKPADAFHALDIERMIEADASPAVAKPKPIVPLKSEPIFGHDDEPIGAYERLADNVDRIRLPDVSAMSLAEREAAAEACIIQIRLHFGLDEQG